MGLIGKKLDAFEVHAFQANKDFFTVTHQDLMDKWSVVCFYPADFTFVCPTELEDLQNYYGILQSMGAEVYSVSTDSHFVHKAWHDNSTAVGKVKYTMLGDPAHQLSKMFNVLNEETGMADRGTFLVDPDGVIQMVEISAGSIGRDAGTILDKLRACQFVRQNPTQACPASWKEGDATLKPSLDLVGKI